jgi:peptide-methionine (R)-S-oxide reductase
VVSTTFSLFHFDGTAHHSSGVHASEFGTYYCRVCDNLLYESTTKYDSGSGWPAFTKEIDGAVTKHGDESHGMWRTELRCARCRSHLGHLFFDGPTESKQRHCINSASLDFEKK